jgi:hypothetical protein
MNFCAWTNPSGWAALAETTSSKNDRAARFLRWRGSRPSSLPATAFVIRWRKTEEAMSQSIELQGKQVRVALSFRAQQELARRAVPLVVEMELYFSCLIRKAVRFGELSAGREATLVNENLYLRFRPVGSRSCGAKLSEGPPPLEDFPVVNPGAYTPDWVEIDYRRGEWVGRFGYGRTA